MMQNDPKYSDSLKKAREHLKNKQYKNARMMYFQAYNSTENQRDRALLWAELSWVYYYEKDYEKAIEAAENVMTFDSEYQAVEDLNRLLGYSYLAINNLILAEKYLSDSLQRDSTSDKQQYVRFELGKLHFVRGQYDQAYPYFMAVIDFFDKKDREYFLTVLFYLGFINYYLEADEQARRHFEQILASEPSDQRKAGALFGLAFLEFRAKNYLNVISLCEKILVLDEKFFDRESLGFLTAASYFYLGRKDIFREYYEKMKTAYPEGRYKKEFQILDASEPDVSNLQDRA